VSRTKHPKRRPATPLGAAFTFLGGGVVITAYGVAQLKAGHIFWKNYQAQPVSSFIVIPVGLLMFATGVVALFRRYQGR